MVIERYPPTDPREWLRFAQNNLIEARTRTPGVDFEIPAFHAQQAAEMAIKAVFVAYGHLFPYVHDLADLLKRLENADVAVPSRVRDANRLTVFASITRYSNFGAPVTENQYGAAVAIAEAVVAWANQEVQRHLIEEEPAQSD